MNIENFLNTLLEVIYKNPNHMDMKYSYKDGKESLIVNGEEMLKQFDDSRIKEKIRNYKNNLELLDDCFFVDTLESLENEIDFKQMDELLNQESFNQSEANLVDDLINLVNAAIVNKIDAKINELKEIRNNFE